MPLIGTRRMLLTLLLFVVQTCSASAQPSPTPRPLQNGPVHHQNIRFTYVTPSELGAPSQGIRLALVPHAEPYKVGKPVVIEFYTVSALKRSVYFDRKTDIAYEITGGGPSLRAHTRVALRAFRRTPRTLVTISPGARLESADYISELYDLPPGRYSVRATITVRSIGARLVSPPASFVVQ
jgi:hypothetical protein